jgi:hypothetical protein
MNHLPNLILAQPALSLVMVIFFWPVVLSSAETFRIRLLASRCQSKQLSEEHPWVQEELMPESSNLPSSYHVTRPTTFNVSLQFMGMGQAARAIKYTEKDKLICSARIRLTLTLP